MDGKIGIQAAGRQAGRTVSQMIRQMTRKRERETNRQTDRRADVATLGWAGKGNDGQIGRQGDMQIARQVGRLNIQGEGALVGAQPGL